MLVTGILQANKIKKMGRSVIYKIFSMTRVEMITLLVFKQNVFKVNFIIPIDANVNITEKMAF